ncbi:MAG: sporulation initiation factor Spo0A C-terminal domain-containing protein [Clostridiales bacterium]|nr:sporulation initiation factor Spo0A C-terminal domain-containing protein [Clostridiales bacterium]
MTKEEHLIRGIMGRGKAGRRDLRILIYAVEIYGRMLFDEKIPPEEILVTKSIYPDAGRKYGKNAESAGRQIERLGSLCFQEMDRNQREAYFGKGVDFLAPKDVLLYLAYYCRLGKTYEDAMLEEMLQAQKAGNDHQSADDAR